MSGDGEWRCPRGMDESRCRYYHDDHPDFAQCGPAPSPSIPDPSDERTHWNLDAFGEALVHTDGSVIEPGDVSIEALVDLIAAVDIHNQITAAACPTSLPEAPEPDGLRQQLEALRSDVEQVTAARREVERNFAHGMISPGKYVGHMPDEQYELALARILATVRSLLAATPSAPPVAVDPEAGAGAS